MTRLYISRLTWHYRAIFQIEILLGNGLLGKYSWFMWFHCKGLVPLQSYRLLTTTHDTPFSLQSDSPTSETVWLLPLIRAVVGRLFVIWLAEGWLFIMHLIGWKHWSELKFSVGIKIENAVSSEKQVRALGSPNCFRCINGAVTGLIGGHHAFYVVAVTVVTGYRPTTTITFGNSKLDWLGHVERLWLADHIRGDNRYCQMLSYWAMRWMGKSRKQ